MIARLIFKFDAAHFLPRYNGECNNLHGHTWRVETFLKGESNIESGMICDFKLLKDLIKSKLPDHKFLNDFVENPTCENLTPWIAERIGSILPNNLTLTKIVLWESDTAGIEYLT